MRNERILACAALVLVLGNTPAQAEWFLDLGVHATRVEADLADASASTTSTDGGAHVGIGVRRALPGAGAIGARLELDDVGSNVLLAVRAFDYRYRVADRLSLGAFIGAARLDLATPAYGYYLGGGVHFADVVPGWELAAELRLGDKIARDNLLPSDPAGVRPDNFYDLTSFAVYLSRRF